MDLLLSICVPTYNRAASLARVIDHVYGLDLDFSFEVVVVDNCSDDGTQDVIKLHEHRENFRHYRQNKNIGSGPNGIASLRLAKGEYCMILCDDDFLKPEGLKIALEFLRQNQHVNCVQAPWEFWDDVKGITLHSYYNVEKEIIFNKGDYLAFFNYIVSNDIYPEIGIYRTTEIINCMFRTYVNFNSYVLMARFLKRGAIAFIPTYFYRYPVRSDIKEDREREGERMSQQEWDTYRGGLEYLLDLSLPFETATAEQRFVGLGMINQYMIRRVRTAMKLFISRKKFIEAIEMLARLKALGFKDKNEIDQCYKFLRPNAAFQALARMVMETPTLRSIILCGCTDWKWVQEIIQDLGVETLYSTHNFDSMESVENKNDYFIIVGPKVDLADLESFGYSKERMMTENDLMSIY